LEKHVNRVKKEVDQFFKENEAQLAGSTDVKRVDSKTEAIKEDGVRQRNV